MRTLKTLERLCDETIGSFSFEYASGESSWLSAAKEPARYRLTVQRSPNSQPLIVHGTDMEECILEVLDTLEQESRLVLQLLGKDLRREMEDDC